VEGFATPLAAAMMAFGPTATATSATNGTGSPPGDESKGCVAAIALVADEGLAGTPKGLVLHWSAASSAASHDLAEELPTGCDSRA